MKLTRQGVRDLNPTSHNGHREDRTGRCRHFYVGPLVVVDHEWALDWIGEPYQREIYGKRCMHCGAADR